MPSLIEKSLEYARAAFAAGSPEVDVLETVDVSGETHVPEIFSVRAITPGGIAVLREKTLAKTGNDGMGALDPRTCFVKGTLVKTANGFVPIEQIKVGDTVASFNEHSGRIEYRRVTETFIHPTKLIYKLTYADGTTVETTWNHPFYIEGRGWIEAKDLRAGMESVIGGDAENGFMALNEPEQPQMLRMASFGKRPSLKGLAIVSVERITRDDTVYNIEVDGNHTYFVTEREVGVHNYWQLLLAGFGARCAMSPACTQRATMLAAEGVAATAAMLVLIKEGYDSLTAPGTGIHAEGDKPTDEDVQQKPVQPKTGKSDPHVNQDRIRQAEERLRQAEEEYLKQRAKPNKTKDDKAEEERLKKQRDHWRRKLEERAEPHWKRGK